jgi:hypothetical protein
MKANTLTTILSLVLATLVAFFLSYYVIGENKLIIGIGSFITLAATLVGTFSISFDYERTTTLTRTLSGVFVVLILTSQIIFTIYSKFALPAYILVEGGLMIMYIIIMNAIKKSKH